MVSVNNFVNTSPSLLLKLINHLKFSGFFSFYDFFVVFLFVGILSMTDFCTIFHSFFVQLVVQYIAGECIYTQRNNTVGVGVS